MIDFISYLLIAGLWIYGVFAAFDSKHIFGKLSARLQYSLMFKGKKGKLVDYKWILRPLFLCNVCMSSVHGLILGLIFFGLTFKIILFVGCLAGIMYISNLLLPEYD